MNRNYLEFQHEMAEVPHDPQVKFYASIEEKSWALKQREKMGRFVIMWSLAGSSVHKTWSGLDAVIAAVMLNYKDVDFVLVGGPECAILEQGWEKEPRVHLTCGKWGIRQSLAFLDQADLLLGSETGVLNAAACMELPKICFLSHSSEENLTRDWTNTVSLQSKGTRCAGRDRDDVPACHTLHYGWSNCTQADDGTAQCQKDITVDEVFYHVEWYIENSLKNKKQRA